MEFRDLGARYRALRDDIDSAVSRVLASGRYIGGEEVSALEAELAGYVGAKHCIACANGTDALRLALMPWGARNRLGERGIPTSVYYPLPCPVTERLCRSVLNLPVGPYLVHEEVEQVAYGFVRVGE